MRHAKPANCVKNPYFTGVGEFSREKQEIIIEKYCKLLTGYQQEIVDINKSRNNTRKQAEKLTWKNFE